MYSSVVIIFRITFLFICKFLPYVWFKWGKGREGKGGLLGLIEGEENDIFV